MRVTLTARVRSGILLEAARKIGSQKALAAKMRVSEKTMCEWVTLKTAPTDREIERRWAEWEIALYEILGRPVQIDSVFPSGLRDQLRQKPALEFEETREVSMSHLLGARSEPLLLASESVEARVRAALDRAGLSTREMLVLTQRYGLDGDEPKTLDELSHALGVCRIRVRQIEQNAFRKIRDSDALGDIVRFPR